MTRPSRVHALTLVVGIVSLAVCLFCTMHRAHAGSDKASDKHPSAAKVASNVVNPTAAKVTSAGAAPSVFPVGSTAQPNPEAPRESVPETAPILPLASATTEPPPAEQPGTTTPPPSPDLTSIPVEGGLPVLVNIALFVLELRSFDDVKGEFETTTDLRLRWSDPRLRYPSRGIANQYVEYRGKAAEEQLAKLWVPNVDVDNLLETTGYVGHRLRVFADGQVETMLRRTGRYKTDVDVQRFPFDVQALKHALVVREQTTDQVVLRSDKDDEEFSRAASDVQIDSWGIGDIQLTSDLVSGWNGDRYARVTASLLVKRSASTGLTTIFIPLLASLLIPLLTLWMNRATLEGFEVDAFELANMGIGGLFSVIALSFAVSSSYSSIAGSDNTVTRLFALNYATLALSLGIVVVLYQRNYAHRFFGPYVHKELFRFILWALPLLTLCTSVAFVLIAAC